MEYQERFFQCPSCSAAFDRKEHLERHTRSHSGYKPFECSVTSCGKTFARRDTLLRHISTHNSGGSIALTEPSTLPPRQRGAQACAPCAKAKQRCQDGIPCTRCLRKKLSCYYATPNPPHRLRNNLVAANEAESTKSTTSVDRTDFLADATARQAVETSLPSTPLRVSYAPDVDVSCSPIPQPLDPDPSLSASAYPFGPLGVSYHTDYVGLGPARASDRLNSESLYFGTGDLNFDFDTFSVPFDEFTHLNQNLSSQYCNTMSTAHPFMRPTQKTHSDFSLGDLDDHLLLGDISWSGLPSDRRARKLAFPDLQQGDEDIIAVENFHHVKKISERSYQAIRHFYLETPPVQDTTFPLLQTVNIFIQLYFEYFDGQFPFLHCSVFDVDEPPWILILAVAAIGSQYSQITSAIAYTAALQELLRRAIDIHLPKSSARVEISLVQSVLLRDISLAFNGSQNAHLHVQTQRNMLITLCRSVGEETATNTPRQDLDRQHKLWLDSESRNRMMYCVYRLEIFQLVLWDLPPLFQLEELTTRPLFGDDLWQCRTSKHWEACVRAKGGLHPFSAAVVPQQKKNTSTCEHFAQEMHLLHLYVEERVISGKLISSPLRKIYFMTSVENSSAQEPPSNSRLLALHAPIMKFLTAFLDKELAFHLQVGKAAPSEPQCATSLEVLAHFLHLLRRIPLKRLYSFVGWKSDEIGIAAAKEDLISWMQTNTSGARVSLWHAIIIYMSLSRKKYFACHEPYFFLISALFIFAYDRLCPYLAATASTAVPQSAESPLLRFDRPMDQSELTAWMTGEGVSRVYVPGIGVLDGAGSFTRLLEHARRILMTRCGWSSLCQGMAGGITQVIQGDRPSYPHEVQSRD